MAFASPDGNGGLQTRSTRAKPAVGTHAERNSEWGQGADRLLGQPPCAEGFGTVTGPREPPRRVRETGAGQCARRRGRLCGRVLNVRAWERAPTRCSQCVEQLLRGSAAGAGLHGAFASTANQRNKRSLSSVTGVRGSRVPLTAGRTHTPPPCTGPAQHLRNQAGPGRRGGGGGRHTPSSSRSGSSVNPRTCSPQLGFSREILPFSKTAGTRCYAGHKTQSQMAGRGEVGARASATPNPR